MYIDDVVNSDSTKSQKPIDIESFVKTSADKKIVIMNTDFQIEKLDALRPRQIGIEK
jgi:hypothetical protein